MGRTRWSVFSFWSNKAKNGGGGGSTDYNDLTGKPKLNNTEIVGNKTSNQLGIYDLPSGNTIPSGTTVGQLFLLLQDVGTVKKGLYRYNGNAWDNIKLGADEPIKYTHEYIYTNSETSLNGTFKED